MSFGFGVSDFLAAFELANRVRQKWVDAPTEYAAIKNATKDLDNTLRDIGDLGFRIDLTPERKLALEHVCGQCRVLLTECEALIDKYAVVQSQTDKTVQSRVRRAWKRLTLDPDDIRQLRGRLVAQVQRLNTEQLLIETYLVCDVKEGVDDLQQRESRRHRDMVADWYSSRAFADQQTDQLARRQPGTGVWFLNHPDYRHWRDHGNSTLLCPGIPGSGKSVIVATVVDDLLTHYQSQSSTFVAYLYCNFNRQAEQTLYHFLAALARQLFQERVLLPGPVEELYLKHRDRGTRPTVDELKKLLRQLIASYRTVFIVIDALDEYANDDRDRQQLLDELFALQGQGGCNINILGTTRFVTDITRHFAANPQIEIRAHREDIERYLTDNMSKLSSFVQQDTQIQEIIKRQIADAADGMFLLARLQFDSLRGKTNRRKLKIALKNLGQESYGLDSAYEDALNRIEQQLDDYRELARRVLIWITYARRELSVEELQEAIAIESGMEDLDRDEDIDSEHDIISACAGLVVVDQESRVVRLVHYTTQEYLERVREQRLPGASTIIAQKCLDFLTMAAFNHEQCTWAMDLTGLRNRYKLLEYAGQNWGCHARDADDEQLRIRIRDLLHDENYLRFISQASVARTEWWDSSYRCRTSNISALHLAALFNLVLVAQLLLMVRPDINAKDSEDFTPLSRAAEEGHMEIVQLLLSQPSVELNRASKEGRTALLWAAFRGHIEMVQLLLKQPGIEFNRVDEYNATALSIAARKGHIEILQLLLDQPGIELNRVDKYGETVLFIAARKGHIKIVQLLLEQPGIELNIVDILDQTALPRAAEQGHIEIVRLLLNQPGIDLNRTDEYGRTALSLAASRGHIEIVQLLQDAVRKI